MMFGGPEDKMPPVAATTGGQSKSVEAFDPSSIYNRASLSKQRLGDKTGRKQAASPARSLPGFIGDPVWELTRYDGTLVAGERQYQGKRFFELRLWAGEDGNKPTKKGVTLPVKSVRDLAIALLSYAERLDAKERK